MSNIYYKSIILPQEIYNEGNFHLDNIADFWQDDYSALYQKLITYLKLHNYHGRYLSNKALTFHKQDHSIIFEEYYGDVIFKLHIRMIDLIDLRHIFEFLITNNCILINYYNDKYLGNDINNYINNVLYFSINKNIS
ncbi:hypothetical protein [Bartonella sp. HY406]|uniref:hypothetical protein n=1 Tax=Bartonella sp. HY406 TaxID=2979331 RepID=UPI0021CA367A|nr:hypothetical protein [Bartonella sp. HY406]UXN04863.1 hypothetical protein N6B01_14235 [Bartonella sp. HY406]